MRLPGFVNAHSHAFQRRLLEEGTSFHQLLDSTRRELAERYLRQRQMSLTEMAYLLGFSDQGNLTRACKRWFALTPGQYRSHGDMKRRPPGVGA